MSDMHKQRDLSAVTCSHTEAKNPLFLVHFTYDSFSDTKPGRHRVIAKPQIRDKEKRTMGKNRARTATAGGRGA